MKDARGVSPAYFWFLEHIYLVYNKSKSFYTIC